MGKDHLVYVRGSGFVQSFKEEYLRYRYRDIQAFTITKTSRFGLGVLYFLGAALFIGIIALSLMDIGENPIGLTWIVFLTVHSVLALIFLFLLLRHFILGPTCRCVIQTSLKQDRIRPLNRLHAATQCLEKISETVALAQEDLARPSAGRVSSAGMIPEKSVVGGGLRIPGLVVPVFGVFALFGLCVIGTLHLGSTALATASIILASLCFAGILGSLLRSIRFPAPGSIRTFLWVSLGLMTLFAGAGVIYYIYVAVIDPVFTLDISGPVEALAGAGVLGGSGFYFCFLLLSIGVVLVSIFGIITTLKWKTRIEKSTAK